MAGVKLYCLALSLYGLLSMATSQGSGPGEIHYIITEEINAGSFVGNIVKDASLDKKYEKRVLKRLRFRFLSVPRTSFVIEEKTGILRTSDTIDRDELCPGENVCNVNLDIAVQPVQYFQIIKVKVEILDLNDNSPTFTEPNVAHQILESASPGASFVLPNAEDPDSPQFGIMGYDLNSDTRKFDLQVTEKVDGSTDVRLILKEKLDREKESEYRVSVDAYDGGTPPKTGSVDIVITIIDANDNDPVFDKRVYEVTVPEDVLPNSSVLKVHATDPDDGKNGRIVYSFSDRTIQNYGTVFAINKHTGDISVKEGLDYETDPVYHLAVVAHDQGPDSLPADATVIVRVGDINDHAPEITVNTLSAAGTDAAEIAEDSDVGTFVAHITVVDKDKGINGEFGCSINNDKFKLVKMFKSEFKIITAEKLDREEQGSYDMTLLCEDSGEDSQVEVKHITVKVNDINDHRPVFEHPEYTATLIENNFVGAYVTQVNASDKDAGDNAVIRFSVSSEVNALFNVDPKSGYITAATSFNREEMDNIKFYVVATDRADKPKSGSALVHVIIQDVNDERPRFDQLDYQFSVFENEPVGKEVGKVHAEDKDEEPYNQFAYSIIRSRSDVDSFAIDPNNGKITTRNVLNREEQSVYYLVVLAQDIGVPPLTSTVSVSIQVSDQNDWEPAFDYPTSYNNTVFLSNMVPIGYHVATIQAHDMDVGLNSDIQYSISTGNEADTFDLDAFTGKLSTMADFHHVDHEVYELNVVAMDLGDPPLKAETVLFVLVNKTVGFPFQDSFHAGNILGTHSFLIIVSLAVGSGVITIILVIAIICIRRKDRRKNDHGKYNCRMEAMKMLNSKEREIEIQNQKGTINMKLANGDVPDHDELTPINGGAKKEECFLMDREKTLTLDHRSRSGSGSQHSWPSAGESPNQVTAALLPGSPDHGKEFHQQPQQQPPGTGVRHYNTDPRNKANTGKHWPATTANKANDMEVHALLEMLKKDGGAGDTDSAYSGDGSNTDSGRGGSEEGTDNTHTGPVSHTDLHVPPSIAEESPSAVVASQLMPDKDPIYSTAAHSYTNKTPDFRTFSPNNTYRRLGEDLPPPPPYDGIDMNMNNHNNGIVDSDVESNKKPQLPVGNSGDVIKIQTAPRGQQSCKAYNGSVRQFQAHHSNSSGSEDTESDCSQISQVRAVDLKNGGLIVAHGYGHMASGDDSGSTTSGSYVVDPEDLCNEIDELFFKDQLPTSATQGKC